MKKSMPIIFLLVLLVISFTGCSKPISFDEAVKEAHSIQKELLLTDMTLESARSKVLDIIINHIIANSQKT